jgi:hypothetical protein
MRAHSGEGHAEMLAGLRAGADARVTLAGSPLAGCPACAELLALEGQLAQLGEAERGAVSAAGADAPPEEGPAERALRARILADVPAAPGTRRGRRSAVVVLVGLAAAAVLALLAFRHDDAPIDPRLGDDLECLHPVGPVRAFDEFRWTAVDGAAWYEVEVRPDGEPSPGQERAAVTRSGRVSGTAWKPPTEDIERWGDRISWTVNAHAGTGAYDVIDTDMEFAERSSR